MGLGLTNKDQIDSDKMKFTDRQVSGCNMFFSYVILANTIDKVMTGRSDGGLEVPCVD